jgi:hypothetical protein
VFNDADVGDDELVGLSEGDAVLECTSERGMGWELEVKELVKVEGGSWRSSCGGRLQGLAVVIVNL